MSKQVDFAALQHFRSRAVKTFSDVDFLFLETQQRLLQRLEGMKLTTGESVILAAEQTHHCLPADGRCVSSSSIYVDAVSALSQLPRHSANLIFSNLAASIEDISLFVQSSFEVLKQDGLLLFSLLGPRTLSELRQAFHHDAVPHVHRFYDMHDVGDLLLAQGFESPVMEASVLEVNYQHLPKLFAELKQMGVQCVLPERRKGLTGKQGWQTMLSAYKQDALGKYPVTVELVIGHAWKPALSSTFSSRDHEVIVAMDQIKRKG